MQFTTASPYNQDRRTRAGFREFVSTMNTDDFDRRAGIGVDADRVIEDHQEHYRFLCDSIQRERDRGHHAGESPAETAKGWNDAVVWEGPRVVAVLRPEPTGRPELLVTRFDRPDEAPNPRAPEPADEDAEKARVMLDVCNGLGLDVRTATQWIVERALLKAPKPVVEPLRLTPEEKASIDADVEDQMRGVRGLAEVEARRHAELPIAWSVTEGECLLYHDHWRSSADEVIKAAVEGWRPNDTHHEAVWHGEELVAVLRPGADGKAEVVRLDAPGGVADA